MSASHAFNGSASLSLRLPRCPSPRCASCNAELRDVRPFRTDQPNSSTVVVDCLAKCARCSTKHRGVRRLQRTPQGVRFLSQSFSLWTDEDSQSLRPVAAALADAAKGESSPKHAPAPVQIDAVKVRRRAAIARVGSPGRRRLGALAAGLASCAALIAAAAYLFL